jgi:peptidoglycan/xylan/chitin deacetylase (PgdA/CDA1 family)
MSLRAAITIDVDTLWDNYKGHGVTRPGGYTWAEFRMGLETLHEFFDRYDVRTTLFMVGEDLRQPQNHDSVKAMHSAGHEISNHTSTHAQGFRLLSAPEKEAELAGMEKALEAIIGVRPVGFRSPGWNVSDDALDILRRRGYLYDSSVFPTTLMPLLKFLHWRSMSDRSRGDRTTMGQMSYLFAPTRPYRTASSSLGRRGGARFMEFPMTVVPLVRMPFFATFQLATGKTLFDLSYKAIRGAGLPIQYLFHLSDFVDYSHPDLEGLIPGSGNYVPQALRTPLEEKLKVFGHVMDTIAADYEFTTLKQWATIEMEAV